MIFIMSQSYPYDNTPTRTPKPTHLPLSDIKRLLQIVLHPAATEFLSVFILLQNKTKQTFSNSVISKKCQNREVVRHIISSLLGMIFVLTISQLRH